MPTSIQISASASERGTAGIDNKIVTAKGKTHVVWQESTAQGYSNVARTLDRDTGIWSDTITLGPGVDNHARPAITMDSQGYLHVILGGHNTPLRYLRSQVPHSTASWTDEHVFGIGTYTSILCAQDNTLVVSARPSGSGQGGSGIDLYIRPPGATQWTHKERVLQTEPQYTGYVGYNASLAWGADGKTLHLAADVYEGTGFYENRGTNQAIVYMRSTDYGDTWTRADGSPIPAPPFPKNADVIYLNCRDREQLMPQPICRLAGLVVDRQNTPCIIYTQHEPTPGEAHLVTPDGQGHWTHHPIADAISRAYPGYGALGARGAVSITQDGRIQMLFPLAPLTALQVPGAPDIDQDTIRFCYATTADTGTTYTLSEPLAHLSPHVYVPTLEKSLGHHHIAADRNAAIICIEGLHRYPEKDELIQNHLHFIELS